MHYAARMAVELPPDAVTAQLQPGSLAPAYQQAAHVQYWPCPSHLLGATTRVALQPDERCGAQGKGEECAPPASHAVRC